MVEPGVARSLVVAAETPEFLYSFILGKAHCARD